MMQLIFWISLFLLFYTYIGYGCLLFLYNVLFKKRESILVGDQPHVTFIVPAYNEAVFIERKIQNTLSLQYPKDKLFFLFVTDGSSDATADIIGKYPGVKLLHQPMRRGKSAAINRAMLEVDTPIVVFSDANTLLHPESIIRLVRHYSDERVGGVSGEKRIADGVDSAVGFGERLYWKYESLLKKANGAFYTIVGAAGELFSIRTHLYRPVSEDVILDDFIISAAVCDQGYRFLYEDQAYGTETSSQSMQDERRRKIRISAGCFQAMLLMKGLLNPFRNIKVTFQYISHRVLRWTLCPLALPLAFFSNLALIYLSENLIYSFFFSGQCAFYLLAVLGSLFSKKKTWGIFLIPYYFVFMIIAQYTGFYLFITRRQSVLWEKANRKSLAEVSNI